MASPHPSPRRGSSESTDNNKKETHPVPPCEGGGNRVH